MNHLLCLSKNIHCGSSAVIVAGVVTTTAGAFLYEKTTRCEAVRKLKTDVDEDNEHSFRIESHLMDRIHQKKYLSNAKDGIPSTFRVLAIDVPAMRTRAFTGECVLSHDKVFMDNVASPKIASVVADEKDNNSPNEKPEKLEIVQKSLARSIVHCSSPQSQQHIGVELLEASVSNLNRFKVRKKQSFGNYTYDPGKYYDSTTNNTSDDGDEIDEIDERRLHIDKETLDEMEAPWNQYAWMEEFRLRINGQIEFDAPVEKASRYERLLFGNHYKSTVPVVHSIWDFFMPFSFARSNPDGIDGRKQSNVRACNKPHAVIANGAALQLVPSSLRLVQKLCKKADVPLFVVHDPRQWGGNTQASLEEALIAMRSTVKNRIISNALDQQGSSAFTRGRMLGQIETETKWQVKDKTRRAKELLGLEGGRRRKPEKEDWSLHDKDALETKLIERKVIRVENKGSEHELERKKYIPGLTEIARECMDSQKEHTTEKEESDPID
eukprot:jgi/Psemu1/205991/e_gw1.394.27.1